MKLMLAAFAVVLAVSVLPVTPANAEGGGGDGTPAVTPPPAPPPPQPPPTEPPRPGIVPDNFVRSFESTLSPEDIAQELFDRPKIDGQVVDNTQRQVRWRLPGGQTGTMRFLNDGTLIFSANGVDYRGTWRFRGRALAVTVPVLDGGKERAARVEKTERISREDGKMRSSVSFSWGGFVMMAETLP